MALAEVIRKQSLHAILPKVAPRQSLAIEHKVTFTDEVWHESIGKPIAQELNLHAQAYFGKLVSTDPGLSDGFPFHFRGLKLRV